MALSDEMDALLALPPTKPVKECGVQWVLEQLNDDEAAKLLSVLENLNVQSTDIASLLHRHGYPVAHQTIQRHRRRKESASGCRCP